jgi:transcriptional regulator with GAF, ATPase, and Fis domain
VQSRLLLGKNPGLTELIAEAEFIASSDSKVLITGESGVGKELLAHHIHEHSSRAKRPMVTINCAGVPESLLESELFGHTRGSFTDAYRDRRGLLELADGGTILLDEVGEMSLRMQALLLRFLESGEIQRVGSERFKTSVDVRVISATNRDLLERTKQKEFREDLYYRLNVVHLIIPPLRNRREDIRPLCEHYLDVLSKQHRTAPCQMTDEGWAYLEASPWPGNVRELKNVAERLALRFAGRSVTLADLRTQSGHHPTRPAAAPAAESQQSHIESLAQSCYERMTRQHESFWTVVYEPFMQRDLTRETVRAIVRMALAEARGNYRIVLMLFGMPATDYKRFLGFLQKYQCHIPFQRFRIVSPTKESGIDSSIASERDSPDAKAAV